MDREYLKHLTDVLAANVDPERIYLFGSCAPLDLLIYTPGEFEELKDVVGTIPYEVAREGVLLYGRATQEAH